MKLSISSRVVVNFKKFGQKNWLNSISKYRYSIKKTQQNKPIYEHFPQGNFRYLHKRHYFILSHENLQSIMPCGNICSKQKKRLGRATYYR